MTALLPRIDVTNHLDWAAKIARSIAHAYKFVRQSQEEDDLVSIAHLTVVQKAVTFDPEHVPEGGDTGGAFRGWLHPHIVGFCRREARRLRNGGTYYTRREVAGVALVAEQMSEHVTSDGSPVEVPDLHTPISAYSFPDLD